MLTGVEIDGRQFTKSLAKTLNQLTLNGEKDLVKLGVDIQKRARAAAPVGTRMRPGRVSKKTGKQARSTRPGNLRRKIRVGARRNRKGVFTVTVRSGAFYGKFLEYGTRNMPPKPFFRPAVVAEVANFRRRPIKRLR